MRRLLKFLRLPARDRSLLLKTWILLWIFRTGLALFSLESLRLFLACIRLPFARPLMEISEERLLWAVGVARRFVQGATCLVQAAALQWLLRQSGLQAELRIGVKKEAGAGLEAHAWVEGGGRVLMTAPDQGAYTPLVSSTERP